MGKALQPPFVRAMVAVGASGRGADKNGRLVRTFRALGPVFIVLGLIGLATTIFIPHKPSFWDPLRYVEYGVFVVVGIIYLVVAHVIDRRVQRGNA